MRPRANHACWSVLNPVTLGHLLDSVLVTYATQHGDKEPREKGKMKGGRSDTCGHRQQSERTG